MAISGNKGEWSEIYTLFKLLGDGKVYAGDADMNKLNLYYPILNVIREESKKYEYKPDVKQNIVVIDEDGNEYARVSMNDFLQEATTLLTKIKNGNKNDKDKNKDKNEKDKNATKGAFEIPETEAFMNKIGCTKLKAPSTNKTDIHIVIHDLRTNMTPKLGFSIKSQLGSASTLLNADRATNITYKITGTKLNDSDIEELNNIEEHTQRMNAIFDKGCSLEYSDIEHTVFKNNLLFMDCCMPQFIANCLLVYNLPDSISYIKDCVAKVAIQNPLKFEGSNVEVFYEHKMKVLLLDSALGMTPAKVWTGRYDANGGYLVVRKDGEIVCYHFYNRNDVEDYLYNNTRFERASRNRYKYGTIYKDADGNNYIKLNLQIRFKK